MKKKLCKMLGCVLFASLVCLLTPSVAKAAVKNLPATTNSGTLSGEVDMDHDGKADSIRIYISKDCDGYATHLTMTMNGKSVYSPKVTDLYCYMFSAKYFKLANNNQEFIQITGLGMSDYMCFNQILTYDNQTGRMRCINSFANSPLYEKEILSASKTKIVLNHYVQPCETGMIQWKLSYKYKNGKFIPAASSTKTVKSKVATMYKNKYSKYFAKNKFVTAKKVTFYKKAGGKKIAFRVPKGKIVTLKKLTYSKKKIYLQFKYGKKRGYLRVNKEKYNFDKPIFRDVNSRLAG